MRPAFPGHARRAFKILGVPGLGGKRKASPCLGEVASMVGAFFLSSTLWMGEKAALDGTVSSGETSRE